MRKLYKRTLFFTKLSVPLNAATAAAKILLGIFSSSFFLCLSGFYNIGIGLAKVSALKTHKDTVDCSDPELKQRKQNRIYFFIGFIIFAASVIYTIYCASKLFNGGNSAKYPQHIAMIIAIVSISEIALSLRGIIISRRDRKPLIEAIKLTNLASSLILLVLTQTAILSFTTNADVSFYNGITGIILGSMAASIGLYMIVRMLWTTNGIFIKKKISREFRTLHPEIKMDLAVINIYSNPVRLALQLEDHCAKELIEDARGKIQSKFNVDLIFAG